MNEEDYSDTTKWVYPDKYDGKLVVHSHNKHMWKVARAIGLNQYEVLPLSVDKAIQFKNTVKANGEQLRLATPSELFHFNKHGSIGSNQPKIKRSNSLFFTTAEMHIKVTSPIEHISFDFEIKV
jgi:hypothetical protein